jgi:hypothetical protein
MAIEDFGFELQQAAPTVSGQYQYGQYVNTLQTKCPLSFASDPSGLNPIDPTTFTAT